MNSSAFVSAQNKMQKVLQFANERRQRIFRVTYIALAIPILILTIIPLLSPIFLQLPNADVVEFQLYRASSTIDIGYYSMCLGCSARSLEEEWQHSYSHACVSTADRHLDGKSLAHRWGKAAAVGPEVYSHLAEEFQKALIIQREKFYPGLLIAAAVFWVLSVGLFATASFVKGSKRTWVLRVCRAFAAIGALFIVGATVATSASAYALVQYLEGTWNGNYAGRMGAILAVQCAAAGAMTVHALLAFAVAGDMQEHSEGSIRLEE